MFSGRSDIVVQFFYQLREEFPKSRTYEILYKINPQILNNLDFIFKNLTELAISTGHIDPIAIQRIMFTSSCITHIKNIWEGIFHFKSHDLQNVLQLKAEIESHLKKIDFKILIIIDDVDRLTPEEIGQLFCGVKILADFPNLIYLIAYDESIVLESLKKIVPTEDNSLQSSRNYLDKIVQFPLPIPTPAKRSLTKYFEKELSEIINGTGDQYFNKKHWQMSYSNGISFFLTNPRKVKSLVNSLKFLYPCVKNEVNFVDFVLLDSLRIFKPVLYELIRDYPTFFLEKPQSVTWAGGHGEEAYIKFHEMWINNLSLDEKIPIQRIIYNLFPVVAEKFCQRANSNAEIILYEKSVESCKGRICSNADNFSKYFRYTLQPLDISLKLLQLELDTQSTSDYYTQKFLKLIQFNLDDNCTEASIYLEKLDGYLNQNIKHETIIAIITSFFEIADQLMLTKDRKSRGLGTQSNEDHIFEITALSVSLLSENDRYFTLLKEGILKGKSITYISLIVLSLGYSYGKFDCSFYHWNQRNVTESQYEELEKIYIDRLQSISKSGFQLLTSPHIDWILKLWRDLTPKYQKADGFVSVSEYIKKFSEQNQQILSVIMNVKDSGYSKGLTIFSLNPDLSKPQFVEIIKKALQDNTIKLTPEEREKIEVFLNPQNADE